MKRYNESNSMHLFANEFSFFKNLAKLSVTGQKETKDIFHFYFYALEGTVPMGNLTSLCYIPS